MITVLASVCLVLGGLFALLAAVGVWRLPDPLSKMHAATKSGAFATAWFLLGAVLSFGSVRIAVLGGLFLVFYYLTAPLGAMVLGRALTDSEGSENAGPGVNPH